MPRLLAVILCALAFGCGDPSAKAPMLTLKVVDSDGKSHAIGRYRVFATGTLSASGDAGGDGQSVQQRVTLEEIADDGLTLSYEFFDSSGEHFTQQIVVAYDKETKVELPNQSTLVATLEANE